MSKKIFALLILVLISVSLFSQEDPAAAPEMVDITEANSEIEYLKTTNTNHQSYIESNNKRKTFLQNRISTNNSRLVELEEAIAYANEINKELIDTSNATADLKAKEGIRKSRNELLSVRHQLLLEQTTLTNQVATDTQEVKDIDIDNERRQKIIADNNTRISHIEKSIAHTQSNIDGINTKLNDISSKLGTLRESVTTD